MSGTTSSSRHNRPTSPPKPAARRSAPGRTRNPQPDPAAIEALTSEDESGIDYGPAIDAIDDLIGWGFELARKDVADWPEGIRRVRNARRYVRALLHGKTPRTEPRDDLLFTAALLVRVFEGEIGCGVDHVATLLDQLGLPLDHAPVMPPTPIGQALGPRVWRHLRAIYATLPPVEAAAARDEAARLTAPERDAWIAALLALDAADGAHLVRAYLRGEVDAPSLQPPVVGVHRAAPSRHPLDVCACHPPTPHPRRAA